MTHRYDLANTHIKIYYKSDSEFEEIRDLCLKEDNWLRNNYTKENLIIEEHNGYGVVFQTSTGEPMVMGGTFNDGRYPQNVAKMINRLYTFPKFRMTARDMTDGFRVTCSLIDALEKASAYEVYLITMQNRNRTSKKWWEVWKHHMDIASNNKWIHGEGYIDTCPWYYIQNCWQNFVYYESRLGAFAEWSPILIDHDQWLKLPKGISNGTEP